METTALKGTVSEGGVSTPADRLPYDLPEKVRDHSEQADEVHLPALLNEDAELNHHRPFPQRSP
ncbi:MAG TPA: hypothetical protein VEZ19_01645 [Rubrobacter sp.]|nr:hypothetical protein [Rubrobacter sp.]